MGQCLQLLLQPHLFLLFQCRLCKGGILKPEVVLLLPVTAVLFAQLTQGFHRSTIGSIGFTVALPFFTGGCQQIHHIKLKTVIVQREILMLGMNIDQLLTQQLQVVQVNR